MFKERNIHEILFIPLYLQNKSSVLNIIPSLTDFLTDPFLPWGSSQPKNLTA